MPKKPAFSKYTSATKKSRSWRSYLSGLLVLFLLLVGLLWFVMVLKTNQDVRQQATVTSAPIVFSVRANNLDNTHIKVDVLINTLGYKLAAIDLNGSLNEVNAQNVQVTTGSDLALTVVRNSLTQNNQTTNFRMVEFASLDPTAQTSTHGEDKLLFSFVVSNLLNRQITIHFDAAASSFALIGADQLSAQYPGDQTFVLQTQANNNEQGSKKSCNQNCATDTECQSGMQCYKGLCRSQPNLEDTYCNSPPDQGIHRSCNQYCADSNECLSTLVCYYNSCRNPKNVSSTSCSVPVLKKTVAQTSTTAKSKGSVVAIPTPAPTLSNLNLPPGAKIIGIDGKPITAAVASPTASPSFSPFVIPTPSPSPHIASPVPAADVQQSGGSNLPAILLVITGGAIAIGVLFFVYKKLNQ